MSAPEHPPIAERLAGGPTPDRVSGCGQAGLFTEGE